jgi:hypothetical protein
VSIYKPVKARWPVALAAGGAGLFVGVAAGLIVAASRPANPVEDLRALSSSLEASAGTLEIVEVEYGESVEDGEIVQRAEYEGALSALRRSRNRYSEVEGAVEFIDRGAAQSIDSRFDRIQNMVSERADPGSVRKLLNGLAADLSNVVDG